MCFITKELNVRRAEQDIDVYKLFIGEDKLTTLYREFPYVEGELFHSHIKESESPVFRPGSREESDWVVDEYPQVRVDWNEYAYIKETSPGLVILSEGVHSYSGCVRAEIVRYEQTLQPVDTVVIRRCVIPAGSLYAINQFGSVISNQIIVKEIVNVVLEKQN